MISAGALTGPEREEARRDYAAFCRDAAEGLVMILRAVEGTKPGG